MHVSENSIWRILCKFLWELNANNAWHLRNWFATGAHDKTVMQRLDLMNRQSIIALVFPLQVGCRSIIIIFFEIKSLDFSIPVSIWMSWGREYLSSFCRVRTGFLLKAKYLRVFVCAFFHRTVFFFHHLFLWKRGSSLLRSCSIRLGICPPLVTHLRTSNRAAALFSAKTT